MENSKWYDCFLEALYKKHPQKPQLTEALMDLLSIEREAVYRRLRNDVAFPASEIVKIASSWNISLDEILGIDSPQVQSFKLLMLQYINPTKQELDTMQQMINFIDIFSASPNAEFMEVSNILPRSLITGFPQLAKYYIFKWMYQYNHDMNVLPFSQVVHLDKIRQMGLAYHEKIKKIPIVNYIWDHRIFDYLVSDIKYFTSIYLITEDEKQLIKNDIYALLDYMSEVSSKGSFPETGNNVNLYISQVNIDTNYNYFHSDTVKISRVRAFIKNEIGSTNEEMATNFRNWMSLKKRTSTQISGVDERHRIEFFMKQHQLVDSL
jgi:hypothetical protein